MLVWPSVAVIAAAVAGVAVQRLPPSPNVITPAQAAWFYNGVGGQLDNLLSQYVERPVVELLAANLQLLAAEAGEVGCVFEFGCGTGTLAELMLAKHLPENAQYLCTDLSAARVGEARRRLARFGARAECEQAPAGGGTLLPSLADQSVDCFVSTFVMDLLSSAEIDTLLDEAYRTLKPAGLLGLASLSTGSGPVSGGVAAVWNALHTLSPVLVGGCRPLDTRRFLATDRWEIVWSLDTTGAPLEAIVARKKPAGAEAGAARVGG